MFGCFFLIFRSVASFILGLVIFFGFLGFLLSDSFRGNFLTAQFYTDGLSENNVYERIYDEVLLDSEFEETTSDLLGDIDIPQEDIAGVARDIITPEYLQEQVEASIGNAIDYLNKDSDVPELYIELGPPLERTKPALFKYIDQRIDDMEDVPVTTMEELQAELERLYRTLETGDIPTKVPFIEDTDLLVQSYVDDTIEELEEVSINTNRELRQEVQNLYLELSKGQLPTRIPSIESSPVNVRLSTYDQVFQALQEEQALPEETFALLETLEGDIKRQLTEGSVKGALEVASPPLTKPVVDPYVDDAYDRVFKELSEDEDFPRSALEGLDEQSEAIKEHLGDGEIKEALKLGARGLAGPLIDEAIQQLREDLDPLDRLDLVAKAAEQNDRTVQEFLDDLDTGRDVIDVAADRWIALLIIILAVVFMATVHFPHLSSALRWPGITFLLSGVVYLVLGMLAKSQLLEDPLDKANADPIPPSLVDIINDVSGSMSAEVAGGIRTVAITIMVIGAAMIVVSFFIGLLRIPFLSR